MPHDKRQDLKQLMQPIWAIMLAVLCGCSSTPQKGPWTDIGSFGDFEPPTTPAHALFCPQNYCLGRSDRVLPLATISADRLRSIVRAALDRQPNSILLGEADEGLRLIYRQGNGLGLSTSTITISIVDADETSSGVALYTVYDGAGGDPQRERNRLERWYGAISSALRDRNVAMAP